MGSYGATFSIVHLFKHYVIIEVVVSIKWIVMDPVSKIGFFRVTGMILESA